MKKSLYLTVALLSAALISYQVILMHILSIVQWHHFAYMIISAAMLGFGASGTILALFKERKFFQSDSVVFILLILTSAAILISPLLTSLPLLSFDSYLVLSRTAHMFRLILNYAVFFIPFLTGALVMALLFTRHIVSTAKLYFSNLLGSAAGAIIPLLMIRTFAPESLIPIAALIPLTGALAAFPEKRKKFNCIIIGLAAGLALILVFSPPPFHISQYKSISYAMNQPGARILERKLSVHGLIEYAETPASRFAPGLSLAYEGEIPVSDTIFLNGDELGPVFSSEESYSVLSHTPKAIPFRISSIDRVLSLEAGTFHSAFYAAHEGASYITAADPAAEETAQLISKNAGLDMSGINPKAVDPRTFLFITEDKYDLITLPAANTFRGTAGLYALREKYILTLESLDRMMDLLSDKGILYIPAWTDYPYRTSLKLLASLAQTLEERGMDPKTHITAVRDWNMIHFMVSASPLTDTQIYILSEFCEKKLFDAAIPEGLQDHFYHSLPDDDYSVYISRILSPDRESFYRDYKFNIRPATDNRPFFLNFITFRSARHMIKEGSFRDFSFMELGYLILAFTFIQVSLAAFILIILPLFKLKNKLTNKLFSISYFSCLGLGFIFLEMVLIQKFTFYFGSPVYSAAFVIAFMLLAAGIGSRVSHGFEASRINIAKVCVAVAAFVLLYLLFLERLFYATVHFDTFLKVLISFVIIFPAGFLMGMPFPLGLGSIGRENPSNVPWCWGIDGCFSVIAASLATLISLNGGFTVILLCVSVLYLTAAISAAALD